MATPLKLQSALEYLTNYSWAIFVIALIILGLIVLGVTNPSPHLNSECVFSSAFSCLTYSLASNGLLNVNIQQTTTDTIYITAIGCTANSTSSNMISVNRVSVLPERNFTKSLQCYTSTGTVFSATPGTVFSGTLEINYTDTQTGLSGTQYGKLVTKAS